MRLISLLFLVPIVTSSCSKNTTEIKYLQPVENKNNSFVTSSDSDLNALKLLLNSKAPNLALAELLTKSVSVEHQKEFKRLISELKADEALAIINRVHKDNLKIRNNYLFHAQNYQENQKMVESSLLNINTENDFFSIENQLSVSVFAYLKNKALDDIVSAYDRRAEELSIDIAKHIIFEIGTQFPSEVNDIEDAIANSKEDALKRILKSKPIIEKIDEHFKNSNLNDNEQYVIAASGIVAGAIYTQVKDNKGFKEAVKNGKAILLEIEKFKKKSKEFIFLVNTLEGHIQKTGQDLRDFNNGINGAKDNLDTLFKEISIGNNNTNNIRSRKIIDFIHKKLTSGESVKPDGGSNSSIFSKQIIIDENINKSINAAKNLTSNLSSILETSSRIAQLIGVKPSKDIQNILQKAEKINNVISTIQSTVTGFATGGFLGAMGALSSGPMLSMMSGASRESVKLEEISKKLEKVLDNQKKMLSMQIEAMNMIKNLALMVDVYHQKEMAALAELRDYSLIELEIGKAQLNKDIRSCERLINYQLSSVWKKFDFGKQSFDSINHIDILNTRFTNNIRSIKDIRRILSSTEEDGFRNCQRGISEAFGGSNNDENPIRSIFSSSEDKNLYDFQRVTYRPLLSFLELLTESKEFDNIPLHLPMKTMRDVFNYKRPYVEFSKTIPNSNDVYELSELVSVKNLERYVGNLLVLYPLLEIDKSAWNNSYQDIVNTYIENSNVENNQNSRSHYFFNNALELIQTAIAQEALLAGEPLIPFISDRYIEEVFSSGQCNAGTPVELGDTDVNFICSIRSNRLLMKNLMMYSLSLRNDQDVSFQMAYEKAYSISDKDLLAKLLNIGLTPDRIEILKDLNVKGYEFVIRVLDINKNTVTVKLPTPGALKDQKVIYSENMSRLLKMQNLVLDALEKVTPMERNYEGLNIIKLFVLRAN